MTQNPKTGQSPLPKPPSPVDKLLDPKPTDDRWLSTDVEPFVPSFLRNKNTTNPYEAPVATPAASHEQLHHYGTRGRGRNGGGGGGGAGRGRHQAHVATRGGNGGYTHHNSGRGRGKAHRGNGATTTPAPNNFSWEVFFSQMQPDDVEMLVELLPADVQMSYYQILEEKSSVDGSSHARDRAHRQNRNEIDKKHSNCFVAAVYETFQQLSPEELRDIQETLLCASADAFFLDDGTENLFVNGDDDMRPDEEEWLMEQMLNEGKQPPSSQSEGKF